MDSRAVLARNARRADAGTKAVPTWVDGTNSTGDAMATTASKLLELCNDRQEIQNLLGLYCRAIDRLDVELLKSLYHPDGTDHHGPYAASAHEFADIIMARLREIVTYGFHTVTHSVIEVHGRFAEAESYYYGYHKIAPGYDAIANFFGKRYADEQVRNGKIGQAHEYLCAGRYLDVLEKRKGQWKILHRDITNEWGQCQPTNLSDEGEPGRFVLPGSRDRQDPVYGLLGKIRKAAGKAAPAGKPRKPKPAKANAKAPASKAKGRRKSRR
jgi:hypothetical protein